MSERVEGGYIRATFEAALDALPTLATTLLLAVGAARVSTGAVTLGRAHRVHRALRAALLADAVHRLDPGRAPARRRGWDRLEEVFAEQVTVVPPAHPRALPAGPLDVRARDLRLLYDGDAGARRRLVRRRGRRVGGDRGPTGVGKSTLDPAAGAARRPRRRLGRDRRCRPARGRPRRRCARRPRSSSRRASCSPTAWRRTSRWTRAPDRGRGRARRADRLGRPLHPRAARGLRHGRGRARPHAVGRRAAARRARAGDRAAPARR